MYICKQRKLHENEVTQYFRNGGILKFVRPILEALNKSSLMVISPAAKKLQIEFLELNCKIGPLEFVAKCRDFLVI